jgi:hypothetical protein
MGAVVKERTPAEVLNLRLRALAVVKRAFFCVKNYVTCDMRPCDWLVGLSLC